MPNKQYAQQKTWTQHMEDLHSEWLDSRVEIAQILVRAEFLPIGAVCSDCSANRASIRCHQSGTSIIFCHQCDRNRHATKHFL